MTGAYKHESKAEPAKSGPDLIDLAGTDGHSARVRP